MGGVPAPSGGRMDRMISSEVRNLHHWLSERLIEFIYEDPEDTEIKREHFRFFKYRGYETAYIDLSNESGGK